MSGIPALPVTASCQAWVPRPQVVRPPFPRAALQPAPSSAPSSPASALSVPCSLTPLPVRPRSPGLAPGRRPPEPSPLFTWAPCPVGLPAWAPGARVQRARGNGGGAGGAGRAAPQAARRGGWAGTRLRPAPRPGGRWRGRGRVPGQGFGLRFRPRGAGRAPGAPRPRPITAGPGLPATNRGAALLPPPRRVLCSPSPGRPSARLPRLRPCDFRPARARRCARGRVLGVCTRVCRALGTPPPGTGPPKGWHTRARSCPATPESLAEAPETPF